MRPVGETEFVNGMAAICASGYCGKTKVAAGIVGHAELKLGQPRRPVLLAFSMPAATASAPFAMAAAWGRRYVAHESETIRCREGCSATKTFREDLAVLGRLGLSFDALVPSPQLNDVADFAGAFPERKSYSTRRQLSEPAIARGCQPL